jgi:hypothetical protein
MTAQEGSTVRIRLTVSGQTATALATATGSKPQQRASLTWAAYASLGTVAGSGNPSKEERGDDGR